MKTLYMVIVNGGDGSNGILWFKEMSTELSDHLLDKDPEFYGSGDGFQCTQLDFPDDFDIETFCKMNYIEFQSSNVEDYKDEE